MVYINIHCHHCEKIPEIIQIQNLFHSESEQANINADKLFSIGIHPWHTKEININSALSKIGECVKLKNVIAIGECGLDKLRGADIKTQKGIFISQINISEELQKPLIIHCIKAFEEIILLKKLLKPSEPWIIHGFRQNGEIAKKLIDEGFYLSFGMQITKNNPKLNLVFSDLPDSSFFLETDDEESHKINLVYNSASIIRNITVENLTSIQNKNFGDCFKVTF